VGSEDNVTQINTGRLYTYIQSATFGAGVQYGSHINSSLQFFSQTNSARKSMWVMLCQDRDLQAINAGKRQFEGTINAEISNVIYMELYSGPKMVHVKYGKTNVAGSID
jgi:hypothetical protein